MSKKKKTDQEQEPAYSADGAEFEAGEQMPLIEVSPEHSKEIVRVAKAYRKSVTNRQNELANEVELKQKLMGLINEEHLQRLPDGTIKFSVEGYIITVTPRDEKVTVKEESESA
jgi:hypothetical protein